LIDKNECIARNCGHKDVCSIKDEYTKLKKEFNEMIANRYQNFIKDDNMFFLCRDALSLLW
jgi:hypothetical protein